MRRKTFFDSRDKYLSFVNSTNEKSKIAFYLFERIEKIITQSPIFNVLDAGTGEGTIISTFLSGLHKYCLLYTSPSPRDKRQSRMPSSA